jgi:CheY-like chemotaxis protein
MDDVLAGRRILVVEDDMLALFMIEDMLADLGCDSVIVAASIDQALALIDGQVFDAALLDVDLGGDDSHPVADALAARKIPFAISTGYSEHHPRESGHDRPVLKKPFKSEELAGILARVLSD